MASPSHGLHVCGQTSQQESATFGACSLATAFSFVRIYVIDAHTTFDHQPMRLT